MSVTRRLKIVATDAVLLDTCAIIWLADGQLAQSASKLVIAAANARGVFVSPISGWEVGRLANPKAGRTPQQFLPDPTTWFARFMSNLAFKEAPLTISIGIAASYLPGDFHADPADRILVATARDHGIPIVTGDRKILEYAAAGHVAAIPC